MNRLQQKCLIGSAAAHGLLVLVLLLAPAFFTPEKPPDVPLLDLIPPKIIDGLLTGGTPNIQPHEMRMAVQPAAPDPAPPQPAPPPPAPPAPKPRETPPPQPQPEPEPPPKAVKAASPIPKIEEEPKKVSKPKDTPKKPEVKVELKSRTVELAKANTKSKTESKSRTSNEESDRKTREQEARRIAGLADAQAKRIADALSGLKNNLSGTTEIYIPGPGSGFFANYAQVVKSVYDRAWVFNDDLADLRQSVNATITIAKDGTVINARIKPGGRSGNPALDRSVQDVLQRVKYIAPFPEGAKEVERTFELNFNPATKRATG